VPKPASRLAKSATLASCVGIVDLGSLDRHTCQCCRIKEDIDEDRRCEVEPEAECRGEQNERNVWEQARWNKRREWGCGVVDRLSAPVSQHMHGNARSRRTLRARYSDEDMVKDGVARERAVRPADSEARKLGLSPLGSQGTRSRTRN